ncbi:FAD binding domain-containing protein [uncultured Thermanaerothrix sp.]|uniref:FAD binding domain-containing protein n=1 Tax=uncultured Thermanaerothrix sp. TaxID=1195149 RepID=UPI002616AE93|nr:FAD binding domain-containing protein [uncultured Thermanaerothrix sp.]
MIIEYYRPKSLEEAVALLQRSQPLTIPLGGGVTVSRMKEPDCAVVDLQDLGLNQIVSQGNIVRVGATVTLQQLADYEGLQPELSLAARKETTYNLRQRATVAGSIVSGDGRSHLLTVLLALDAVLIWAPGEKQESLGDFLALRDVRSANKGLITEIRLTNNAQLKYEYVARTPEDRPILLVAVAKWPSGRTRVVVGGFGKAPALVIDGPDASGAQMALGAMLQNAGDEWASAVYRQDVAQVLLKRCLIAF